MDQGGRGRAQVEQSPRNSSLKRGGKFLAQRTQFKLCKNQRFDLPGPKTRFFSTRRPQNLHVVHSAQTRTRPLAIDMHVGGRANTRSRDPGRTKLYCQSSPPCPGREPALFPAAHPPPRDSFMAGRFSGAGGRLQILHGVGGFRHSISRSEVEWSFYSRGGGGPPGGHWAVPCGVTSPKCEKHDPTKMPQEKERKAHVPSTQK